MAGGSQTVGYRYLMSLHMGIARGPLNELVEIRVGDLTAWTGITDISEGDPVRILINSPNLFGGDSKEGGIVGPAYLLPGGSDQVLPGAESTELGVLPSIEDSLGGDVPAFRGVTTVWYDGIVTSMNPYPKPWSFRWRRSTAGWYNDDPWYPAKAAIQMDDGAIVGMNPAHILYEINTNPEWGRGMPADLIDENSYIYAANFFCAECFGLCIPWFRRESLREFTQVVIDHIGGVQYVDRETGKMTLRILRNDYILDDLPIYGPDSGLLDIVEDDASAEDTAFNEIICKGFDPVRKEEITVRVQNMAAIQSQGEIISNTIEYPGIPTKSLLTRIAARELRAQSGLRKMTIYLDRRGWRVAPGMPFRVQYPAKGIGDIVLRPIEIRDGTLTDGRIELKCIQDVFSLPDAVYLQPQDSLWEPPAQEAEPSPESRLLEANYRDFYRRSSQADRDALASGDSFIGTVAKAPDSSTHEYKLLTRTSTTEYGTGVIGGFTAWLTLAAGLLPLEEDMEIESENFDSFMIEFVPGMVALIDDEQIEIVAYDEEYGRFQIKRGVGDTIPDEHEPGATIWLVDDEMVSDGAEYQDGETVFAVVLPRTFNDELDQYDAEELSLEVDQRVIRPYPPGDVRIDDNSIYEPYGETPVPLVTWTHRDRITQADQVVDHTEGSIGPEPGVTYTITIFAEDGETELSVHSGIVDPEFEYTVDLQYDDGSPEVVWMELKSVRGGLDSFFSYMFRVELYGTSGWGYSWGYNWGGLS